MSTFYLQGCDSENNALEYFDSIYLPVQELIDLDTEIQENLFDLLVSEEELDSINSADIEEAPNTAVLEKQMIDLKSFIIKHINSLPTIKVIDDEENLKYSYKHLLNSYLYEIDNTWPQLIKIINSEDIGDEDMERFNILLQQTQLNLDKSLNKFYDVAEFYASRHNIEIEKLM